MKTRLRFKDGKEGLVSHVIETKNGPRFNHNGKVVVPNDKIKETLIRGVLYNTEVIPMRNKNGYIATAITPIEYNGRLEVVHVPKCLYQINIFFGNQKVIFDPKDGRIPSVKDYKKIEEYLRGRVDLKDREKFVDSFVEEAKKLINDLKSNI